MWRTMGVCSGVDGMRHIILFFRILRSCFSRMTQDLMAPPIFFISLANGFFFLTEKDGQPRLKNGSPLGLLALEFLAQNVSKIVNTLNLKPARVIKTILLSLSVLRLSVLLIAQRLLSR